MTDRAKAKERDEVLKRMLKMKPRPHKDSDSSGKQASSAPSQKPKRTQTKPAREH